MLSMPTRRRFSAEKKKCGKCSRFRELDKFSKSNSSKDGLRSECYECEQVRLKEWRESNKYAPPIPVTEKKCICCKEVRGRKEYVFSKSSRDHLTSVCRQCATNNHGQWYRKTTKLAHRNSYLSRMYGLNLEEFNRRLEIQKGLCMICKLDMSPRACVDHSHETGQVRDLLCNKCNSMLGALDSPEFLTRAIAYIIRHHPNMRDYVLAASDGITL